MNSYGKTNNLLGEEDESDIFSTVLLTVLIVIMVAVFAFICFFQLCSVNGQSMTDTIQDGDNVLITHYDVKYKTGDIIVLDVKHGNSSTRLIKRIVAVENETFKFECRGTCVDFYKKYGDEFVKIDEPYIKETMLSSHFRTTVFSYGEEYTVPENSFLFLGDNRNDSSDSRVYGFAEKSQILGKMVKKLEKGSFIESVVKFIFHATELDEENKHNVLPLSTL